MTTMIQWQDPETFGVGFIRLDATTTESPEDTLTITDHPVEQGVNVVDHAREAPTRLSIEGVVSTIATNSADAAPLTILLPRVPVRVSQGTQTIKLNPPKPPLELTPGGLIQAGVVAAGKAIFGGPNMDATFSAPTLEGTIQLQANVLKLKDPSKDRVRDVYDALLRVQSQRTLVLVSTRHRDYFDMLIERIAKPRVAGDGNVAKFQIDFKRIRVAASQRVAAPKPAPAEIRAKPAVNKGAQAAVKDEDPKETKKTLSQEIIRSFGGARGFVKAIFGGG